MTEAGRTVVNLAVFYAGWVVTVLCAAHGWRVTAIAAPLAVVAIHVLFAANRTAELRLVAIAALVGLVAEISILGLGLARYALSEISESVPPSWLVGLWMAFATTITSGLSWLQGRLLLSAVLGAAFAPLSYYAGAGLGGMDLTEPAVRSLSGIGVVWAVALPILIAASDQCDEKQRNSRCG
jgi:hypothetical protein